MGQTSFVTIEEKKYTQVNDLPEDDRPVNRVREAGPSAVSKAELIACVLQGNDSLHQAHRLLTEFGGLVSLSLASEYQLTAVDGIGPAQAARLKAAIELGRRWIHEDLRKKHQIHAPSDIAAILMPILTHKEQETFMVIHLDTRNRIINKTVLYKGSVNASLVRIGEVFRGAVRHNCTSIVVAHNHPSGDPNPSPEDVALTGRLVKAGKLLEIEVLDHLVIGNDKYVSMRERRLGFDET